MQFSKGQQKIIEKAKNKSINQYTKEQIECLSVPMLVKQCQTYSDYFRLCNFLDIPPENSMKIFKEKTEELEKSICVSQFIIENFLNDIDIDKAYKRYKSFGDGIYSAKNIAEQFKSLNNSNECSTTEKEYLGKFVVIEHSGVILKQLFDDMPETYLQYVKGLYELAQCLQSKYKLTAEELIEKIHSLANSLLFKGMLDNKPGNNPETKDLLIMIEYLYPDTFLRDDPFYYDHEDFYKYRVPSLFAIDEYNAQSINQVFPNYTINSQCLSEIIDILKNVIILNISESYSFSDIMYDLNDKIIEHIVEDAEKRTPVRHLDFNVNTGIIPMFAAKKFMQCLETISPSLLQNKECKTSNDYVEHSFFTKYNAYEVKVHEYPEYETILFTVGHAHIYFAEKEPNPKIDIYHKNFNYMFIFNVSDE